MPFAAFLWPLSVSMDILSDNLFVLLEEPVLRRLGLNIGCIVLFDGTFAFLDDALVILTVLCIANSRPLRLPNLPFKPVLLLFSLRATSTNNLHVLSTSFWDQLGILGAGRLWHTFNSFPQLLSVSLFPLDSWHQEVLDRSSQTILVKICQIKQEIISMHTSITQRRAPLLRHL